MTTALDILDRFERLGWKGNDPMSQMLELRREQPTILGELVTLFLDRALPTNTFIDAALDLMDDDTYSQLVGHAWQRVRQGERSRALIEILEGAALQLPSLFHDDWELVLQLSVESHVKFHQPFLQAWRELDEETVLDWCRHFEDFASLAERDRDRAIAILLSRHEPSARKALSLLSTDPDDDVKDLLLVAGYALDDGVLRSLHNEAPHHIRFDSRQWRLMQAQQPEWIREIRDNQASWQPAATNGSAVVMGGVAAHPCGLCHQPLHRLLRIAEPRNLGIACETDLELATCLSCETWEEDILFFRHDRDGRPSPHPSQQRKEAQTSRFPAEPLLEAEAHLFAAPRRWERQDWGASNNRQNLSRVGGAPSWVQTPSYPDCPDCEKPMPFIAQFDSGLPQSDESEWLWGSGGCSYAFWCPDCRISAHFWQCT